MKSKNDGHILWLSFPTRSAKAIKAYYYEVASLDTKKSLFKRVESIQLLKNEEEKFVYMIVWTTSY